MRGEVCSMCQKNLAMGFGGDDTGGRNYCLKCGPWLKHLKDGETRGNLWEDINDTRFNGLKYAHRYEWNTCQECRPTTKDICEQCPLKNEIDAAMAHEQDMLLAEAEAHQYDER